MLVFQVKSSESYSSRPDHGNDDDVILHNHHVADPGKGFLRSGLELPSEHLWTRP